MDFEANTPEPTGLQLTIASAPLAANAIKDNPQIGVHYPPGAPSGLESSKVTL